MKRKLLLAACVLLLGANALAQETPVNDGVYYMYNETSGLFLTRGENWGTQAVAKPIGMPWKVSIADGKYKLRMYDLTVAGSTTGFGSNCYSDNGSPIEFTPAGNASDGFTLKNGDNYITCPATAGAVSLSTTSSSWKFLTQAQYDAVLTAKVAAQESTIATAKGIVIPDGQSLNDVVADVDNWAASTTDDGVPISSKWTATKHNDRGGNTNWDVSYGTEMYQCGNGHYTRTITGLKQGIYKVSVRGMKRMGNNETCTTMGNAGYPVSDSYLDANGSIIRIKSWYEDCASNSNPNSTGDFVAIVNNGGYISEGFAYVGSDGNLVLNASSEAYWGGCWFLFNGISYTFYNNEVSEEDATSMISTAEGLTGPMLGTTATALTTALAGFKSSQTIANYNALSSAVTAAQTSIPAYASAATAIAKANAIKDANNFVSSAALTTFAAAIAAISDAYDARTLADATAAEAATTLGTNVSGWRANATGAAGVYISSIWDNSNDWSDYYINTWSTEGDNDGSGFSVPFFEYWVGSGSLAARTMTGTLAGLKANQLYKISADVRVGYSSKVDGSITLTAGDGTPVDVTTGAQIGSTGRYMDKFTAYGKSDGEGNLTAVFEVAENSGISWLCWQNVYYEETNLDFSGLNTAITTATTLNASVTNGVSSLATAITTAQGLLESATTQSELDTGVTALESAISTAESIIAARLNLAGVAKKATALKSFIDDDIDTEISGATDYSTDADATAAEAASKANALNAHFADWEEVTLTNANFDTGWNGDLIEPGTAEKPYVHAVDGWTQNFKFSSTASQGIAAEYGSAAQNGTNGVAAPNADMYGNSEGGTLHLSSGWSDQARYYQNVALSAGKYVFYYEGFNANNTNNALNSNYFGISNLSAGDLYGTNNTFIYADDKSFVYNEWKACAFGFTLLNDKPEARVNVGLIGGTGGSGSTPKMWFDNVTIYRVASPANMAVTDAKWGTFYAPFEVEVPSGVTAYTVADATDGVLNLVPVSPIPAKTPVVLYSESVYSDTKYGKAETGDQVESLLTGTLTRIQAPNGSYILQKQGEKVGFYQVNTSEAEPYVPANRAYIAAEESFAKAFFFPGDGDDEATLIEGLDALTSGEYEGIYTMGGVKVNALQKGTNIVQLKSGKTLKINVK